MAYRVVPVLKMIVTILASFLKHLRMCFRHIWIQNWVQCKKVRNLLCKSKKFKMGFLKKMPSPDFGSKLFRMHTSNASKNHWRIVGDIFFVRILFKSTVKDNLVNPGDYGLEDTVNVYFPSLDNTDPSDRVGGWFIRQVIQQIIVLNDNKGWFINHATLL